MEVLNETGEKAMGKAKGMYMTLEAGQMAKKDQDYHRQVSKELSCQLRTLVKRAMGREPARILVAGLGNPSVTPDSLGPQVLGNLCVTRHMDMEYGRGFLDKHNLISLSAVVPVSYTHLDVYKRQQYSCAVCAADFGSRDFSHTAEGKLFVQYRASGPD